MKLDLPIATLIGCLMLATVFSPLLGPWPSLTSNYAVVVCILGAAAAAHMLVYAQNRNRYRDTFSRRDAVTPGTTFDQSYASSGLDRETFVHQWNECARLLEIPPELLRVTDRFKVELAPTSYLDGIAHPLDRLVRYAVQRGHPAETKVTLARIETFGQLVEWLTLNDPR